MVRFWQIAVGAMLSSTVIIAVQVSELPLLSVTVKITVLAPKSLQSKVSISKAKEEIPQASLDPLSTCAGVMEASPF